MPRIAYILLCHKDPDAVIAQAGQLTAAGDYIAIHFDARAAASDFDRISQALAANPSVLIEKRRVKCGWGEWSLVQATLNTVTSAVEAFPRATHFYLLSGDCMPIKTAEYAHAQLAADDVDYIESFDFFHSEWIKTGIKAERLIYRHWFNERRNKWLFYTSINLQARLGMARRLPHDVQVQIGSQWWCLRRRTIESVLEFCKTRPDVVRFFRRTWIPDETFFQTLVRHLVADAEIRSRTLTFLMFTDYGMPVTFYNDHFELLLSQDFLFARKVSPDAADLKARLGQLYSSTGISFAISGEGRSLFRYLAGQGRVGRRFAPRFWEREASVGRGRRILMVACKKWHVGKRLVDAIGAQAGIPALHYLFDEEATPMPDLGGIESNLEKRARHRRALLRMIFDRLDTDRLAFCVDPGNLALLHDLNADPAETRLLEVVCTMSDDYLIGHARRVGLAGPHTSDQAMARLLPTIRFDIRHESDRIEDADFPFFARIRETGDLAETSRRIADFLDIAPDVARSIAATDHLFAD